MSGLAPLKRLVIASHNQGKVEEIAELLRPYGVEVLSAAALGLAEPEETGQRFSENAEIKARAAAEGSGEVALADDSGLVVPALGGRPGVHSARWAGPGRDFGIAMERVERELGPDAPREASFICVLCLATPEGATAMCEGRVDGTLVWPPRGAFGFGYDPMFKAAGQSLTFGEMEPARKHAISHRAHAFARLVETVFGDQPSP